MTCETFEQLLPPWLTGELSDEQGADMQAHLAQCGACQQVAAAMQGVLRACEQMEREVTVPPEVQAAWRRRIRAEAAVPQRSALVRRSRQWAAAAAVLVMVAGGMMLYRSQIRETPNAEALPQADQNPSMARMALPEEAGTLYATQEDGLPKVMAGGELDPALQAESWVHIESADLQAGRQAVLALVERFKGEITLETLSESELVLMTSAPWDQLGALMDEVAALGALVDWHNATTRLGIADESSNEAVARLRITLTAVPPAN